MSLENIVWQKRSNVLQKNNICSVGKFHGKKVKKILWKKRSNVLGEKSKIILGSKNVIKRKVDECYGGTFHGSEV